MLGETLAKLRDERNLTQQQVADKIHISRATYAQYEINRRVPEYLTLEKLADFFDKTIDYLVGREPKVTYIEETILDRKKNKLKSIIDSINDESELDYTAETIERLRKK